MVKFFVHRPIAVIVSFFAILLLGITAYVKLPISLLPKADISTIYIKIDGEGLSSKDVEDKLTYPMRTKLSQIKGLIDIQSVSSVGLGTIKLEFDKSVDINLAFLEVNEKVDISLNNFPKEIPRPSVVKSSVSDIPVFRLNIYPKDEEFDSSSVGVQLSSIAREVIRRRIEQIPEAAMVDMTGYLQDQVEIIPKKHILESLGLNNESLIRAFQENTINLGSILVKDGHYRYFLQFSEELQSLDAIKKTPLSVNGRLFTFDDITDIVLTNGEESGYYQTNGRQAINFAVIKQSSSKMDDLKAQIHQLMDHLKEDYPNIVFELTQDQTELLDFSINNLKQDLILGGVLAFFLMMVFIRKIRIAILIGITVPISLIISQLGFYLFDISLNIISLGGLILGLSMIIDNSIVVMDTIAGYQKLNFPVKESAVLGTTEIIRPLITSVMTNCAVFIPLIFLNGLVGAIFFDQAISIVIGVVSSLFVSIILLPPLYSLIQREDEFEIKPLISFTSIYDKTLKWFFKFPVALVIILTIIISIGVFTFQRIEKTRLPRITKFELEILIDWNEYITIEEAKKRTREIYSNFDSNLEQMNVWGGPQKYLLPTIENLDFTQNKIYLKFHKSTSLNAFKTDLENYVKQKYPLASILTYPAKNAFEEVFKDNDATLILKVSGHDYKMPTTNNVGALIDTLKYHLPHLIINPIQLYESVNLRISSENAARYGLSTSQISQEIKETLSKKKIADYQLTASVVPLVIKKNQPSSIYNFLHESFVMNRFGEKIPLTSLVINESNISFKNITSGVGGEYYPIEINTDNPKNDLKVVSKVVKDLSNPDRKILLEGAYFKNNELIKDMSLILIVSILLLYFILAAQFESLLQPLFILIELPISIFGSFIILYLANSSINLMSMIGIVVMSGLIINDSILKIDAINQLRNKGVPLMEAIFEGGHKRIRSIIMISLTSIGALLPTLFMSDLGSELQKPLALSLIGGMVVGLFISLFFVPVVYWFIYKKYEK